MARKKATELGGDFEDEVQESLELLKRHHRCMYERKYDSRSAGAYLPAQPCDFAMQMSGRLVLLECKSSETHPQMNRKFCTDNLRDAQVAGMRLWMRSGSDGFYLFKDHRTGIISLWPGEEIIKAHITPRYAPDQSKVIISWMSPKAEDMARIFLMHCFNRELSYDVCNFH